MGAMARLASFLAGRRTKWLVPAIWLVAAIAFAPLGAKLAGEVEDSTESFLPAGAESTEVVRILEQRFEGGQTAAGLVIYRRAGGLTPADRARIAADARRAEAELPVEGKPILPFGAGAPPGLVSRDRTLAYSLFAFPDDFDELGTSGKKLREIVRGGGGLETYVTGDAGFSADFEEVFGDVDKNLLIATVLLVLVLLGAIYRSPLIAITPLIVVGFAYTLAQGFIYLYAKSGATVNSQTTSILIVLMFGVGTDYCLLLVSRYREELRNHRDKHDAMHRALERVGAPITASGLTVVLTMLVLLVADTGSINALGPVAAIGVACALLASMTLLPALLTIYGRRGFWPRRAVVDYDPEHVVQERTGIWRRIGDRVLQRPGLALAACGILFGAGGLGLLAYKENYSTETAFKTKVESVEGFKVLQRAFPAGSTNPTTLVVARDSGRVSDADLAAAAASAKKIDGVAAARPDRLRSRDGRAGTVSVVFRDDPFTVGALERVPPLREQVAGSVPGARVLVGGGSAVQYDFDAATARDTRWIVPLGMIVIFVILAALLRALVAPLVLIASVLVSFFGTFGLSILFFRYVVGDPGVDASLPVFAFIFLVALGVDYTIFLMSRVREEARRHGTREGTLRALSATGPVITSAGLILAGTFSVLMTLPVTFAFNIGFMVAVGILLDTFVVRTVMVPAAVELIGERVWWPSNERSSAGLHEEPAPAEA